ncbi:MAG: alpha/beta hydrolase [Candidatus Omnitrophota bacterium]
MSFRFFAIACYRQKYRNLTAALLSALLIFFVAEAAFGQEAEKESISTKEHITRTKDGWDISIKRYLSEDSVKQSKGAVILCHGFNFNNLFWDLDERSSLARYLARNGYDVWAPSLRGSGLSSKTLAAGLKDWTRWRPNNIGRVITKAANDVTKRTWTIDDHIHQDVPAIVDYVREKSGFDKVYWIGHSMGSIIMFGYLETEGEDKIAGFISVGSMVVMTDPLTPQLQRIADQEEILAASLLLNTKTAGDLRSITFGAVKYPMEEMLLNRENMYKETVSALFRKCIEDTSSGVIRQFSYSIRNGRMLSSELSKEQYDYTANLGKITIPIMVTAGGRDAFVDQEAVVKSYHAVSSKDKQIAIFSKENGYPDDYGHSDVLIGKNSEKEVYPVMLEWLDECAKQCGMSRGMSVFERIWQRLRERFKK